MSASSSTMRISADMPTTRSRYSVFQARALPRGRRRRTARAPRRPFDRGFVGGVTQLDASAMILDNAADDGEPKSGALLARRDIRLEQTAAIFLRQADPVIDDINDDVAALARGKDSDRALAKVGWRYRCNRFGRVLDEVGERLRHQAPVEPRRHRILGDIGIDFDFRIADAHQEHS